MHCMNKEKRNMGLLSALFGGEKKEKKPKQQAGKPAEKEYITIENSLGKFYYEEAPNSAPPEYGYDGDIKWRMPKDCDDGTIGVYFDSDAIGSHEAGHCFGILEKLVSDKKYTETRAIGLLTRYVFDERPDLIGEHENSKKPETPDELAQDMKLRYISIYRNGDIVYSVYSAYRLNLRDPDVRITEKGDGTVSIELIEYE